MYEYSLTFISAVICPSADWIIIIIIMQSAHSPFESQLVRPLSIPPVLSSP